MKLLLSSLAVTIFVGIWMVVVAFSQLALLNEASTIETVSGSYSNPVNRSLKQDRLIIKKTSSTKAVAKNAGNFCEVGGFERTCKFQIAGLKVSPPLVHAN